MCETNVCLLVQARPKHMACIAIASFQLAAEVVCRGRVNSPAVPEAIEVAAISQCKCTIGDLQRMQGIITTKLGSEPGALPVTAFQFLQLFHALLLSVDQAHIYSRYVKSLGAKFKCNIGYNILRLQVVNIQN